jgi:hypothetical protein
MSEVTPIVDAQERARLSQLIQGWADNHLDYLASVTSEPFTTAQLRPARREALVLLRSSEVGLRDPLIDPKTGQVPSSQAGLKRALESAGVSANIAGWISSHKKALDRSWRSWPS